MDFSIDIETLGLTQNSAILSIGCCEFDIESGEILRKFHVGIEHKKPIKIDYSTFEFWLQQPDEARASILGVFRKPLKQALQELNTFLRADANPDFSIWANGTKFDLAMLENVYLSEGLTIPWKYNADRCMRTLRAFAGSIDIPTEMGEVQHDALCDAIWQAKYISAAVSKLGLM